MRALSFNFGADRDNREPARCRVECVVMPNLARTELRWGYSPEDLFAGEETFAIPQGTLTLAAGAAMLVLHTPIDPVPTHLVEQARDTVYAILMSALLGSRRPCQLNESVTTHQVSDTGVSSTIVAGTGVLVAKGVTVTATIEVHDKFGVVISNSEQLQRRAMHDAMLAIYPKIQRSATLRTLLQSFMRSIEDVDNELVHLYEINDALKVHFGSLNPAAAAFPGAANHLRTLGKFANFLPLAQGRHRGSHAGNLRPATDRELEDMRNAALALIRGFATTVV